MATVKVHIVKVVRNDPHKVSFSGIPFILLHFVVATMTNTLLADSEKGRVPLPNEFDSLRMCLIHGHKHKIVCSIVAQNL